MINFKLSVKAVTQLLGKLVVIYAFKKTHTCTQRLTPKSFEEKLSSINIGNGFVLDFYVA